MTNRERKERNAFLRFKYKAIKNKTGDSQIAKRASQWSISRINKEFNLNLIDPKVKKQQRLNKLRDKYAIVRNATGNPQLAKKASQWSDEKIESVLGLKVKGRKNVKLIPIKYIREHVGLTDDFITIKGTDKIIRDLVPEYYRHNNWVYWSKNKFPKNILEQVYKINLEHNLDVNSSYGYGIVYYSYIENKPINEVLNQYKSVDYGTGMILYTQTTLLG